MLLYYVRHGDPIYNPDSLTPLGKRQAEAVAHRIARYGVDRVFASTSTRAIMTSQPTCEICKKTVTLLDFCHEGHAWDELTYFSEQGQRWLFHTDETRRLFITPELLAMGENWYEHPKFKDYNYKKGIERIRTEADKFFLSLGYEHIPGTGAYRCVAPNDERVALFAHQGFGLAFLSCLLDIPYPRFSMHFDHTHTGMTVIEFKDEDGIAIPRILTLSNDSHLYGANLPLYYDNSVRF